MADVEEPQYTTLAERIAALNRQKNFQSPSAANGKRPPPPPPPTNQPKPPIQHATSPDVSIHKTPTVPARPTPKPGVPPQLPRRSTAQVITEKSPPLPSRNLVPPLPTRRPSQTSLASPSSSASQGVSPALPPRANSAQLANGRRNSNESDISYISTISNLSLNQINSVDQQQPGARRLPPTLDQANLPLLPPTRRELEAKAKEASANGTTNPNASLRSRTPISEPPRPSVPPRLPSRPVKSPHVKPYGANGANGGREPVAPPTLPRRLPPVPTSYERPASMEPKPKVPTVPTTHQDAPPPIPLASRPTDQQIEQAVSGRNIAPKAPQVAGCLICRDFSAADALAAQFPLQSLPRHNVVDYLARALCDPFPSLTDKARAVFTWCHHNIRYDVEGFFGNCIPRGLTPDQTILSGKAVCEGYARVYQSIAERGGLQCVVVTGHGKGYGFNEVAPGQPPPRRDPTGHAWNAVVLDDGRWKLLDACWGAGHLGDGQSYNQKFSPLEFTSSNEIFGLKHFPSDWRHFYREDGRIPTWEEYVLGPTRGPKAQMYNDAADEGFSESTLSPAEKFIPVNEGDDYVRFQIGNICEHWNNEIHGKGKPRPLILRINGPGGNNEDYVALDNDGFWWWVDVPRRDLGRPGQTVSIFAVNTIGDESARGVTKGEYLNKKGKFGMSFAGIAAWELS
ncbi:hypothetical protein MCOR22_007620 [Pyricularia oryzae]|nr:hypothetical protein MCOR22_007620 [Pyricularia oryzae]